jgi:hypothetical protein
MAQCEEEAKKYFRCLTCEGNLMFEKTNFTSRDKTEVDHVKETLSTEERNEWMKGEIKKQLEEYSVALQQASTKAQHVRELRKQAAVSKNPGPEVFRLDFGMFKRSTINASDMYWILDRQSLKDCVLQKKQKVARTMALDESGDFQSFHPHTLALHRLNVYDEREYRDTCHGSPETVAVVLSVKMPPQSDRTLGRRRADIEVGEHCLCKWHEGERHFYSVWVGIEQRGSPSHLFLRPCISSDSAMFPGVTRSNGEGRVPPLTSTCLDSILKEAFIPQTKAILMVDSAKAYQALPLGSHGICRQYLVNGPNKASHWLYNL